MEKGFYKKELGKEKERETKKISATFDFPSSRKRPFLSL
jgi:hypothetical protein